MKPDERTLLQERVRVLVLRHALESTLARLAAVSGGSAADEMIRLEHAIVTAVRNLQPVADPMRLSTLVAVEDAIGTVRTAFDVAHHAIERAGAARTEPTLAA